VPEILKHITVCNENSDNFNLVIQLSLHGICLNLDRGMPAEDLIAYIRLMLNALEKEIK